jgi:hypothetical protein
VGASNGSINRVTIANSTSAGNLTDATGTFAISNSTVSNQGSFGFASLSTVGSLNWTVSNSSFSNTTQCAVCEQPSGTASQNLTVTGSSISNRDGIASISNTAGTAVGLNVNNCTVNGGGLATRGIDVSVQGNSVFTGILTSNNITGCTGEGMLLLSAGNATCRAKIDSNRLLGNQANFGFNFVGGSNSTCAVINNNTSDRFNLNGSGPSFGVELFSTFATRNTGALATLGTINTLAAGACGLP